MAATDFPNLTAKPNDCPSAPMENTISSVSEAGYAQTRPRTTRRRMTFGPVKMILSDADWALLYAHDVLVTGAVIFTWLHPVTNTSYQVRYSKRVTETPINIGGRYLHNVEFTLETV